MDVSDAASVAVAQKANEQQKVEGANAVRLIETAKVSPTPEERALPPDSTISVYA